MTDTKYVPLRKALLWSKGPGADDRLRDAAVALRVAGPDDAIVPLDALRWTLMAARYADENADAPDVFGHLATCDDAIAAATPEEQTP